MLLTLIRSDTQHILEQTRSYLALHLSSCCPSNEFSVHPPHQSGRPFLSHTIGFIQSHQRPNQYQADSAHNKVQTTIDSVGSSYRDQLRYERGCTCSIFGCSGF